MYAHITQELKRNKSVFKELLVTTDKEIQTWKSSTDKWCLLEMLCHLVDEEVEDFRVRIKHVFKTPELAFPPIDPVGWVKERKYMEQNFKDKLDEFLKERDNSIDWLRSLQDPKWDNFYSHKTFGKMSGKMLLTNWLAHDYIHIRQILKIKMEYHKHISGEEINYAGNW